MKRKSIELNNFVTISDKQEVRQVQNWLGGRLVGDRLVADRCVAETPVEDQLAAEYTLALLEGTVRPL